MSNNVEVAATICQLANELIFGSQAIGDKWSVHLQTGCPGGSKPIGIFHTHPGGEPVPSAQDISEAKRLGMQLLCVSVPERHEARCYRVK